MRTWGEVRSFASQKFRLTPDSDSKILEQEPSRSLKNWLRPPLLGSGVQRSGDPRGNCLIVCPLTKIQFWTGVWWSLLLDIRCLWRHNVTSYSHLQTNVLVKLIFTTCV